MTKPSSISKRPRKQHSPEFRSEALKLAERTGVAAAVRELSLYESQLYTWRSKQQQIMTSSERESELAAENARLKRQLAEQSEEPAMDAQMNHESVWNVEQVTHDEKPNNPTGCDGGEPERQ